MEEKKVITMENRENECENNDEVLEEVIEKESLFNKAKRFVKGNKKKILASRIQGDWGNCVGVVYASWKGGKPDRQYENTTRESE